MTVDFANTAGHDRRHRAGFPGSLFDRLAAYGTGQPGQRVIDPGTGTATLARRFARRGRRVIALDPATPILAQAREIDRTAGVEIGHRERRAEDTGLPTGSADRCSRSSLGRR